jgi:glycosyltransferase involved in cell wall biosynthesis
MTTSMRISIALCTFNGERFLSEQLQSIASQSRLPDELIAFDDGSTDRTMQMLEAFAKSAPFPVQVRQNAARLGPAQNFAAAITAASGDIICFCDQDDIWHPQKLQTIEAAFKQTPRPAFVFSDAEMCDADGKSLGYRLWSSVGFTEQKRRRVDQGHGLDVLIRQNVVTGATLAFDATFRSLLLPIPSGWMHDGWIALLLSVVSRGAAILQPLIQYRQHASQSIGAQRRSLYQQYLNAKNMDRTVFAQQADQFEAALARLQEQTDFEISPRVIRLLQLKILHCRRRDAIRQRNIGRIIPSLVELFTMRYQRFSLGWKSFAQDLFL